MTFKKKIHVDGAFTAEMLESMQKGELEIGNRVGIQPPSVGSARLIKGQTQRQPLLRGSQVVSRRS